MSVVTCQSCEFGKTYALVCIAHIMQFISDNCRLYLRKFVMFCVINSLLEKTHV